MANQTLFVQHFNDEARPLDYYLSKMNGMGVEKTPTKNVLSNRMSASETVSELEVVAVISELL